MREDFSETTKRILGQRVGNRCSNPDCHAPTTGPQVDAEKAINIGVAAHITAASSGGPGYDPSVTSAERAHPTNEIWLCQSCAKLVDNDPSRYSKDVLVAWKQAAEMNALAHLEHGGVHPTSIPLKAEEIDLLREAVPEGDLWLFRLMSGTWVRAGSINFS